MHYAYAVKIPKGEAKTSEEAREQTISVLDSNGFASQGGFFSSSKADWYVIGGRSSGMLTYALRSAEKVAADIEAQKLIDADLGKDAYAGSTPDCLAINEHIGSPKLREQLEALYIERLGVPFTRSSYNRDGYEDDAMIITPELREALKNAYYRDVEVFDTEDYEEKTIKDLSEKDDGAWLVMVDYHN